MQTRQLTAEVSQDLADRLASFAHASGQAPDAIIATAVAAWIDQEAAHREMTLAAMADVDAGRLIDHAAVRAWANSLGTGTVLPVPSAP